MYKKLLACGMALLMCGCSAKAAGNDQVLTVGLSSEMNGTFSPMYYQTTNDSYVVDLVYQGLLKYNKKGELVVDLAKSLPEISEDGKTMTFKLKKGIQFSDGSKFTSKDVQTTFTVMADPSYTGRFANNVDFLDGYSEYHDADASSFTGVETPDNYTVVFHLDKPRVDAVSTLGTQKICSSEYLNYKKGKTESIEKKNSKPIGTGAYVLKKFEKTSGASLVSNSKFKAKKGQYQISKIMIKKTDTSTEVKELENGTVDYIPDVIEANKIKSVQKNKSLSVDSYPSDRESFIIFNSYAGACSDVVVRKAIGYGFNAQEYIDNYYQIDGMAYKPGTFGNPVSLNNGKMIRNEEKVDGVTYYDYDVEKANQILEDAGYTLAEDGYRYKDGEKLTVRFLANKDKDSLDSLIPVLQKCLNAIGIDFKANTVEFNTVINTVQDDAQTDSWDATYLGFSYGSPDDTGINFILRTGATNNFGRLSDEQLDAYLDAGMYTSDNEVSKENYHNALVRQSELCGYLPVDSTKTYCLRNKNIKGMHTTSIYNWAQSIATAYILTYSHH